VSPGLTLYLIAALVYLSECLLWLPSDRLALITGWGHAGRPLERGRLLGTRGGGLWLLPPLPPLVRALVVPRAPALPTAGTLAAAQSRVEAWQGEARELRWLCHLLWLYLFVAAPLLAGRLGLAASWLPLAGGLLLLDLAVAFEFWRAHRALYPERRGERIGRVLALVLSPPAAIRADEALGRYLLATTPALTAAVLLGAGDGLTSWARRVCHDEGLLGRGAPIAPEVEHTLRTAGLSIAALGEPPAHRDPGAQAYCPRCHAQLTGGEPTCPDCGVLALAFPPPTGRAGADSCESIPVTPAPR
jgi:hypothetical protein